MNKRKQLKAVLCLVLSASAFLNPQWAQAARVGKVIVEKARVYEFPNPESAMVGQVVNDTQVQVSNRQTNGFFKIRIPGGQVGWIFGTDVLVITPDLSSEQTEQLEKSTTTPSILGDKFEKNESPIFKEDHSRLQIYGGIQTNHFSGLPLAVHGSDANSGTGAAVEMQFQILPMIFATTRLEYLSHSGNEVSFKTMPILAGFSIVPISTYFFRLGFGAVGGLSPFTSLSISQSGNTAKYESLDWMAYGNAQMSFRLSSRLAILLSADYRLQEMEAPASTALSLPSFVVDLGGIAYRGGLEFRF